MGWLIAIGIILGLMAYIAVATFTNGWFVASKVHGHFRGDDGFLEGFATCLWPLFWGGWLLLLILEPLYEYGMKIGARSKPQEESE